ncbi:SUMF1/EgtB/PvdO family nonheme iron enzyme [Magnetospirillum sp. 15-1]|uniref:formylglycine-generating enzyme family protein n=1 Tax=Magnetospirillum sp. 15-1 TaxID=1979370 RepID=UPI000BBC30F3|nr:SUMF1/EgtB/PvdO family nonheme iron enzyme [Magnetospirillum sp. 15-1]
MRKQAAALVLLLPLALPATAGEWRPCPQCPPMVGIPAGTAMMGDDGSNFANEKPAVPVTISRPFALSATEVTFDEWQKCVAAKACKGGQDDHTWGRGKRPVINITWDDARAYAAWVGKSSGLTCRLPSEAEWEYAARAGTSTGYWWGEEAGNDRLNCRDCLGKEPPYGSRPARSFPPNPWGLYEMNGNVWEWTADCWTPDHSSPAATGDNACRDKVVKGGSWYYFSAMSRASARAKNDAAVWSYNIGIRVLCELPEAKEAK